MQLRILPVHERERERESRKERERERVGKRTVKTWSQLNSDLSS